jgi:arginine decarboxylase
MPDVSIGNALLLVPRVELLHSALVRVLTGLGAVSLKIREWRDTGRSYESVRAAQEDPTIRALIIDVSELGQTTIGSLWKIASQPIRPIRTLFAATARSIGKLGPVPSENRICLTDVIQMYAAVVGSACCRRVNMEDFECHEMAGRLDRILRNADQSLADRARTALQEVANAGASGTDHEKPFLDRLGQKLAQLAHDPIGRSLPEVYAYVDALRSYNLDFDAGTIASNGCDRDATSPSIAAKITATILIVEDEPYFANELRSYIQSRKDQHLPFALNVQVHVPSPGESALKFRERLEERLRGSDGTLDHLQAAIIDHAFDKLSGQGGADPITGITLGEDIRRLRPGTDLILLTGGDVLTMLEEVPGLFDWAVSKHDPSRIEWQELLGHVLFELDGKLETPFWTALHGFAKRSVLTFHAPSVAHARSAKRGVVLDDFVNFYGDSYFHAETSATLDPLDNLLHPTGSIKRAQSLAARGFGSDATLFVTNGTSTANKIVLQAVLKPGDAVIVDRNCHISHHYALALAGARPYFLEPLQAPAYGISTGVAIESIVKAVESCLSRGISPSAILLTNCTFDGVILDPARIMAGVGQVLGEKLKDTVFVFDEAWFAFARFHPQFIERTALAAAKSLKSGTNGEYYRRHLRVYVTQSTHKTLSAFRQGSMIHISDPLLIEPERHQRLEEAFLAYTTTSPHSGIIASLDVARRQAELEGCALLQQTLKLAREFRHQFSTGRRCAESWQRVMLQFAVLGLEDLVPTNVDGQFALDPTKITLHIKAGYTGDGLRKRLLDKYGIQVNKTSQNTVLFMFNIGTTKTAQANLKKALLEIGTETPTQPQVNPPSAFELPAFSGFWRGDGSSEAGNENNLASFFHNTRRWPLELLPVKETEQRVRTWPGSLVAARFITPYPPGYPVLVPGQIVDVKVAPFLKSLGGTIHGTVASAEGPAVPVFLAPISQKSSAGS